MRSLYLMNKITYNINERIEKDGYEQALLYFESDWLEPFISREQKFMLAIKDNWIPIIRTREHKNDWLYYEFLMKRKIKNRCI